MKRNNSIAIVLTTMLMLVASFCVMWFALTVFGKLSDIPFESEQKFTFNNNLLGIKISQQDYENYPIIEKPVNEIPDYMKNYILQPQDAAVLAAKQIKNICGFDLKGYNFILSLNTYDKCWEGFVTLDLEQERDGFQNAFYMDAVSGELYSFGDGRNFNNFEFSIDDYNECSKKALAIAKEQFPDKADYLVLQDYEYEKMQKMKFLMVAIEIEADRVAHYIFLKNDKDEFYVCTFNTR